MGILIDNDKLENAYRCIDVKNAIIAINLIGPPISFLFLLFGIIRMCFAKKKKTFLTKIILIIFFSEVVQTISKMLQMVKYAYDDQRDDKTLKDLDLPRGIICQIQIVLAISSDYCSLISTLLLTLRCYDVMKKKRLFDTKRNEFVAMVTDIVISISLGIIFLIIDRARAEDNISYRYDVRDRCSYWCWLEHGTSLGCFGVYAILLVFNIIYAFKTYCHLKKGYSKLIEETESSEGNKMPTPLVKLNTLSDSASNTTEQKKLIKITKEEMDRIKKTNLAKIKSLIYPLVTIIYWSFAAIYRITDDAVMWKYDYGTNPNDPDESANKEKEDFTNNPSFKNAVEFFFVVFTLFSSIRGILYGLSFMAFEEKIFFNICKKVCKLCLDEKDFAIDEDDEDDENEKQRNTEMSMSEMYYNKKNEDNKESDEECEEVEDKKLNKMKIINYNI